MYEIDKSDGWVKNWRRIKYSPWYQNPFTAHLAQHLIREVSRKPAKVFFSGSIIELSVGQTVTTLRKLSKETGIPLQRLGSSIAVLEKCQFLTHQATQCYSIISILKYASYQDKTTTSNTPSNTEATQYQHSAIYNDLQEAKNTRRDKEKINKKEKPQYNANFEKIWARYPVPIGKKVAWRHYKRSVKNQDDYNAIHRALDIYLATDRVRSGIIQNGSTWFNRWRDYLELAERQTQETTSKPSTPAQDDRKVQTQRFQQFIRQARSLQDIADYILDNTEWEHDYYDAIEKKKGLKALAHIKRLVIGQRQQLTAELRAVTAGIGREI